MVIKAVQQFMLGTVMNNEAQARDTMGKMKAAGYDGIELCGFMIHPTGFMVRLMTKAAGMPVGKGGKLDWKGIVKDSGLQVVSLHTDLGSVERDPAAVAAEARAFGTKYAVITGMYRFAYGDEKAVRDLAARVNFEFDSYWFAEGGANPLEWMERLGERMKLWHINDRGARLTGPAMTPILKTDSAELGTGNMPLEALAEQAKRVGVEAVVLESHRNWVDKSPVKSFQASAKFLNKHF